MEHTKREVFSDLVRAQQTVEQARKNLAGAIEDHKKISAVAVTAFELDMNTTSTFDIGTKVHDGHGRFYQFNNDGGLVTVHLIETNKL